LRCKGLIITPNVKSFDIAQDKSGAKRKEEPRNKFDVQKHPNKNNPAINCGAIYKTPCGARG